MMIQSLTEANSHEQNGAVGVDAGIPRVSWGWALVVVAAVVYGSLIPFDVTPSIFGSSVISSIEGLRFAVAPLSDRLLNIAIFVPIGFLFVLCRRSLGSSTRGAMAAVGVGLAISVAVEATQTHLLSRVASWYDVILNVTGLAIGAWVAIVVRLCGVQLSTWMGERLRTRLFSTMSAVMAVGLLMYGLFPFDFVTSTDAMFAGFRSARWDVLSVRYASLGEPPFQAIVTQLASAGWFALLGYISAFGNREVGRRPGVAFGLAVKHGVVLACLIEGMQLFTNSHVFDLASVVLRSLGVVFGAWAAVFVVDELSQGRWRKRPSFASPGLLLGFALVFQLSLLAFESIGHGAWSLTNIRVGDVSWIPFRSLWEQTTLTAIASGLAVVLWYGSMSLGLALLLGGASTRRSWSLAMACVLCVAIAIEVIKAGSFGRTPDTTDVALAIGASIVTWRVWQSLIVLRLSPSHATQV